MPNRSPHRDHRVLSSPTPAWFIAGGHKFSHGTPSNQPHFRAKTGLRLATDFDRDVSTGPSSPSRRHPPPLRSPQMSFPHTWVFEQSFYNCKVCSVNLHIICCDPQIYDNHFSSPCPPLIYVFSFSILLYPTHHCNFLYSTALIMNKTVLPCHIH